MLVDILGMVGGGLLVALATKAIPRMMSEMMSGMMLQMLRQVRKKGFDPIEMCKEMKNGFSESQPEELPNSPVE